MTTPAIRRLATTIVRAHSPGYGQPGFDDHDAWRTRLRLVEATITALYTRAGSTEPDTTLLIAQMLDDEGDTHGASLVRQLFPTNELPDDYTPHPSTTHRLAELRTGPLAVVLNLTRKDKTR